MDTIQYLSNKVHLLELKIDSLQKAESIKELSLKINEQADIVSNVGNFYESAWLKLVIVISVLGIVIPLLIQYFQKSNLKEVADFLSKEVKDVFELKIKNLKESNDNQFEILSSKISDELSEIQNKHLLLSNEIEASLFYLQGKQQYSSSLFGRAIKDFVRSTEFWSKTSKPERMGVPLDYIKLCINHLKTSASFEKALIENDIDWPNFIQFIRNYPDLRENLNNIKESISKLVK